MSDGKIAIFRRKADQSRADGDNSAGTGGDGGGRILGPVERLYRDYWGILCRRLRRIYGDGPPEPEDLAQIAFARVIEQYDHESIERPGALLFRIAVNAGLDNARKNTRARRFIDDELAYLEGSRVEEITPSDVYESKARLRALEQAIATLPQAQREALLRSRLKGESYSEIAAAIGSSPASISRSLASAMKTLALALGDTADDNQD